MNKAKLKNILNWLLIGCTVAGLLAFAYCLLAFVLYAATLPN